MLRVKLIMQEFTVIHGEPCKTSFCYLENSSENFFRSYKNQAHQLFRTHGIAKLYKIFFFARNLRGSWICKEILGKITNLSKHWYENSWGDIYSPLFVVWLLCFLLNFTFILTKSWDELYSITKLKDPWYNNCKPIKNLKGK